MSITTRDYYGNSVAPSGPIVLSSESQKQDYVTRHSSLSSEAIVSTISLDNG